VKIKDGECVTRAVDLGTFPRMNELEATETLGAFLERVWLPVKQTQVEVATYDQYAWAVSFHIAPLIGALPLTDVTGEVLGKWLETLITAGPDGRSRLGPTSARTVRKVLSMGLDDAVRRGLLRHNPVDATRAPRPPARRAEHELAWDVDDALRFLTVAQTHRLAALFHLGLVTGLRRGELLALRWMDINVEEHYLYVRQQLAIERNRPVLKPLRSDGGPRIVTFGRTTAGALARRRSAQSVERDRAGRQWTFSGLVFTTRTGGWVDPSNMGRLMDGLIETAGIPRLPPKGLRHTAHQISRRLLGDRLADERLGRRAVEGPSPFAALSDEHREAGERLDQLFAPAVDPVVGAATPQLSDTPRRPGPVTQSQRAAAGAGGTGEPGRTGTPPTPPTPPPTRPWLSSLA
jgi:integrase